MKNYLNMKNKLFIRTLPYFIFVCCTVILCTQKPALCAFNDQLSIEKAQSLLNQGKYFEALGKYQEIATYSENENTKASALFFIGRTYSLYLDQYDTALKQFYKILKKYPDSQAASDALFSSGMVFFEQKKYEKAYKAFALYLKKYPNGIRMQSAEVWADTSKSMMGKPKTSKPPPSQKLSITNLTVRVLVEKTTDKITIESERNITVETVFSRKLLYSGTGPVILSKTGTNLVINGKKTDASDCRIKTDDKIIKLNKSRYRGYFTITAESYALLAVNHINIEKYLYGVVPREMPSSWSRNALMAQAVAARTYALHIKEKSKDKPYDVVATVSSQVYGGYDGEKSESNAAVDATTGQVMTYNDKLIVAYFHSNSGGYTESPQNVWTAEVPYLEGVPDKYCNNTPGKNWEYFLSYKEARSKLSNSGITTGNISKLQVDGKSESGRALKIKVVNDKGVSTLSSNNFRIKIGGTKIKSTHFQTIPNSSGVLFKGKGYGHGVGMSQWGAYEMAKAAMTTRIF